MIYERWIGTRPEPKNWIVWSRYEEDRGKPGSSRSSISAQGLN